MKTTFIKCLKHVIYFKTYYFTKFYVKIYLYYDKINWLLFTVVVHLIHMKRIGVKTDENVKVEYSCNKHVYPLVVQ